MYLILIEIMQGDVEKETIALYLNQIKDNPCCFG